MSKIALITGSSTGIGCELAQLFAKDGYRLILNARNRSALEEQASRLAQDYDTQCQVLAEDLSDRVAVERVAELIRAEKIDVLVNNAGFGAFGRFSAIDIGVESQMIQVNIAALVHLSKAALPHMIERKSGKIMNVASMAGFVPGPFMAVYYSTKAFVVSFSQALAEELKDSGIVVSVLCPGPTATEFQKRAGLKASKLSRMFKPMTAQAVAQVGYESLMRGETVSIPGSSNKLMACVAPLVPRDLVPGLVRKVQEARD